MTEPGLRVRANRRGVVLRGIDDAYRRLGCCEDDLAQELPNDARTQSAVGVRAFADEEIDTGRAVRLVNQRTKMRVVRHAVTLDEADRIAAKFNDEAASWIHSGDARRVPRADLFKRRPSRPPSRDEVAVQPSVHRFEIVDFQRPNPNL